MLATAVLLCSAMAAAPPAPAASAPPAPPKAAPDPALQRLVADLPATFERLISSGPEAAEALRQALPDAPAGRKALLAVALAAALNQEGDAKAAREALQSLPAGAAPDIAARAAYEDALAAELAGDKDAVRLYERAAAAKSDLVACRAHMRLAVLHKFAGRYEAARRSLERAADLADSKAVPAGPDKPPELPPAFAEIRQRAGDAGAMLEHLVELARAAKPVPARSWRLRLADTFAAPELTYPGYDRWFRDGKLLVLGEADRFTSVSMGLYSGGGSIQAEALSAEFALRVRKTSLPDGRWRIGFAARAGYGRPGIGVHAAESRLLAIVSGDERLPAEAPVYRPRGTNVFRVVAVGRRIELYVNGLPLEAVVDVPDARGGLDLLAFGCIAECDWCRISVPAAPGAPAGDSEKILSLNAAALDDAAAGRSEAALEKLTELAPMTAADCESRLYLFRLMRSHGTERHLKMIAELWPDKIDRYHWFAAEHARLAMMARWADPALRPAFAESTRLLNELKHADALRVLDGILAKSPGLFAALDARAEAYKIAGNAERCAEDCEAALKADPKALSPLLRLAWLARRKGDWAAEVKALERVLAAFPRLPEALRMMDEARRKLRPRKPKPVQLTEFRPPADLPEAYAAE